MGLIEQLEMWDRELFLWLNGMHAPVFDFLMTWITYKYTWVPVYAFMLFLIYRKYGLRHLFFIIPAVAVLVLLTDMISYQGFKQTIQRYRPCHNLDIQHLVHLVTGCGGKYGFLSGHATNSFGVATFLAVFFTTKWWRWGLFFWAALVAYSRIYVGVHYPSDIVAGAALGILIGLFVSVLLKLMLSRFSARSR